MPTQADVDAAMRRLGCERSTYGRGTAPGGYWCPTHNETWWHENGAAGCRRAYLEATEAAA